MIETELCSATQSLLEYTTNVLLLQSCSKIAKYTSLSMPYISDLDANASGSEDLRVLF